MAKQERLGIEKALTKATRQSVIEISKGKNASQVAETRGVSVEAVLHTIKPRGVLEPYNAKEQRKLAELDEILDKMMEIVRKQPETKLKYTDVIAAAKLKSELDGHLKTHSDEKHIHLHAGELGQLSEAELRKQLKMIEQEKSSNLASGEPLVREGPIEGEIIA